MKTKKNNKNENVNKQEKDKNLQNKTKVYRNIIELILYW